MGNQAAAAEASKGLSNRCKTELHDIVRQLCGQSWKREQDLTPFPETVWLSSMWLRQQCFHCRCCCNDSCRRSGCFYPKKGPCIQSRVLFFIEFSSSWHSYTFSRRPRHGSTVLNCLTLLLYLALPTLHCSMWQLQIITNQSVEVAARAEVAPGEKVVGIDLGTTNSAVAAMEVLKLSDYLKIWPLKMLSAK